MIDSTSFLETTEDGGGLDGPIRVLVVEDEDDIAALVKQALERGAAAQVEVVTSGDAALACVAEVRPELIVLDVNLPVMNGFEVCRILRARSGTCDVPIIMLTARTDERDRVTGLDLGADDYITKPFSLRELTARVRAVLRRRQQRAAAGQESVRVYHGRHLTLDLQAMAVFADQVPVRLTRREFDLLHYLVEHRSQLISRDRLLQHVWGYDASVETRSVDVHIARLRAKLGTAGEQIETRVGFGYRFVE